MVLKIYTFLVFTSAQNARISTVGREITSRGLVLDAIINSVNCIC